jgi:hypothetical protein
MNNEELLKKLEEQRLLIEQVHTENRLQNINQDKNIDQILKRLGENSDTNSASTLTGMLENLTQSIDQSLYAFITWGTIGLLFAAWIILFIVQFKELSMWKKVNMKKRKRTLFFLTMSHSLLITGVLLLITTIGVFFTIKDTTFLTVFTVIAGTLISLGVSLGLSNEQKIDKAKEDSEFLRLFENIIRGKKLTKRPDIVTLSEIHKELIDINKLIPQDISPKIEREIKRLDKILESYLDELKQPNNNS